MSAGAFPALGFDPAPGDVATVQRVCAKFSLVASEVQVTARNLREIDAGSWKGKAAEAFIEHVHSDLTPPLTTLSTAFTSAAEAVRRWATLLEGYQQRARALEKRAEQAQAQLAGAKQAVINDATTAKAKAGQKLTAAETKAQDKLKDGVTDAGNDLNSIIQQAQDLRDEAVRMARNLASELTHAKDMAPHKPGWLSGFVHDVEGAWDDTWGWVKDHAALIKLISDILSDISGILSIIAIITAPFEPIGAIFEGLALVTGAAGLLTGLLAKAAGANESWATLGMDAISLLPGAGALKDLKGGVKIAEVGAESLEDVRNAEVLPRIAKLGSGAQGEAEPFTLFGKTLGKEGVKITGIGDKGASIGESLYQNLRGGQYLGTKGLRLIGNLGSKVSKDSEAFKALKNLDQTSKVGRGIDAGIKIATKAYSIPHGIITDVKNLGDTFGQAAGSPAPAGAGGSGQ